MNSRSYGEPHLVPALPTRDDDVALVAESRAVADWPEGAYREIVYRLAAAAEFRDDETGNHIARMASYACSSSDKSSSWERAS